MLTHCLSAQMPSQCPPQGAALTPGSMEARGREGLWESTLHSSFHLILRSLAARPLGVATPLVEGGHL